MSNVAFIGLGNMGSGMCANLVKAGHSVKAFDLNPQAIEQAINSGATGAESIADCVTEAEYVITMLPAGKHVHSVYFDQDGITSHALKSAVLIDCSTIAVSEARDIATQAAALGYAVVDAPVSGGVAAANAGTLTFMVGGSAFAQVEGLLGNMGQNIFHAGISGNGQAAKTANNMLLGISMIATSEAFNLAEKLGLSAEKFFEISSKASGQCWSMTSYCPAPGPVPTSPANNDYTAGFAVAMMLKDLKLAQDAGQSVDAATPLGQQATAIYQDLDNAGLTAKDFSVVMQQIKGEL
ncbi:3-hydroxyisobutyrate dehydrogenase [Pseudomonadales bacterium]|nr:3-hydroxyisobutyrate dehydrogenase [Pseudomonadales bacterium]MDB9756250.1 3-hydroxyisobutyrate dehydrogenase [Pseudomonadales bacterium]